MNRLVRADIKRIITKPGMFVTVVIMALVILIRGPRDTAADEMEFYKFFFNIAVVGKHSYFHAFVVQ